MSDAATGKLLVVDSSFNVPKGSCLAIVGESGSGKSLTCKSIVRLNGASLRQTGEISFQGESLNRLSEKRMRTIRGKRICMIFQNGMSAFDPSCVIGVHMRETLVQHFGWSRAEIEAKMIQTMESVMLQQPLDLLNKYPHQLSGGMLQRMMIALALVMKPDLIIADEPTTALDAIAQYEVMEQFSKVREMVDTSMIFVSHDLAIVKKIADAIIVMKDGHIIERGTSQNIFSAAEHEYTRYLLSTKEALSKHYNWVMGRDHVVNG